MENQLHIFVMERGFVLVGVPEQSKDDFLFWKLTNCGVVRNWGTTEGLGQLAREGPLSNTKIDQEPNGTEILKRAVYRKIPCNTKAWNSWLSSNSQKTQL